MLKYNHRNKQHRDRVAYLKEVYMQYTIAFLEGIITFISPCLLPMLPIYVSYFAGGGERSQKKTFLGALGFVTGFTIIFVAMGALAGTLASDISEHSIRTDRHLLRTELSRDLQAQHIQRNFRKDQNRRHGIFLSGTLRSGLLHRMDALCRSFSRIGSGPCIPAGTRS